MKEKLIKLWERKERYIINETSGKQDWRGKFMKFRLIDDPLCDVNEDIPAYENCEDCPYFWDCMEEDDEDEM